MCIWLPQLTCVHPLLALPAGQVESAADIAAADKLVFPGVGAFGQAMHILQQRGYVEALRDYIHVRPGGPAQLVQLLMPSCSMQLLSLTLLRGGHAACPAESGAASERSFHAGDSAIAVTTLLQLLSDSHLSLPLPPPPPYLQSDRPFMGICLGMQLLFEGSEESGGCEGLALVPGRVTHFDTTKGLPVPHIGWNDLIIK